MDQITEIQQLPSEPLEWEEWKKKWEEWKKKKREEEWEKKKEEEWEEEWKKKKKREEEWGKQKKREEEWEKKWEEEWEKIREEEWEQAIKNQEAQADIKYQTFQAFLQNKWERFQRLYTNNEFLHTYRFNRFEGTALHIAISSYHPDRDDSLQDPHLTCIKEMIASIPKENRLGSLKLKNGKGNTPLHLVAELGIVPIIECLVIPKVPTDLIWETNSKGETPLFITAYRGKLQAFLYLQKCVQDEKEKDPIELCRREDGDNILHAAISHEHFELAFQIIHYYPLLVNRCNTKGMSPLHVLSRMPQLFRRGRFRFIDSMIHCCINIDELELITYKPEDNGGSKFKPGSRLPENYQTLVEFLELLRYGTRKIRGHQSHRQNHPENPPVKGDPENPPVKDATGATNENQENCAEGSKLFPGNYTIFVEFLKCLMKIVLIVLAIGLPWIKKLEERKRQHARGVQIMKLLIAREERYKFYQSTGEEPEFWGHYDQNLARPTKPPIIDDHGSVKERKRRPWCHQFQIDDDEDDEDLYSQDPSKTAATEQSPTSSTAKEKIAVHKPELSKSTKETPILVASKMGIVEMVKMILKEYPIAIQDMDSDEKNILLLAVEHRQPDVYNWLMGEKYPPHVYYQVDKDGNNAVHVAAMFQKLEVWRTPGSALQLQDERKWYKYVKQTLPQQSYVPYNNKGQTPRAIFIETHADLLKDGTKWLIKTANSCSVIAALIATVAFATAATIPGGSDESGHPHLQNQPAFEVFCTSSLVSLCFSVSALVFFLAILTSRCQHKAFERALPRKLLIGLTSLFASISAILVSFCAAHFFVLQDKFKSVAFLIYGVTCIPVVFFAFNQLPLYVDLMSSSQKLPIRSYKEYREFYTNSSVASSSDQKKAGKDKDD